MTALERDRLYDLLPQVYRIRDAEIGYPLRELLRIVGEQADLVEGDIGRLYDNWFIETCEDWVVPYLGELIGFHPAIADPTAGAALQAVLSPRAEVANTIRNRGRKGTIALIELLARDVANWPARAVESFQLLAWTQAMKYLHLDRARLADMRDSRALELIGGAFDQQAHTFDVRRAASRYSEGRFNLSAVAVFLARLNVYGIGRAPAYCQEQIGLHAFSFSVLGNDAPLFTLPVPESGPYQIAGELNLPVPIRRRALEERIWKHGATVSRASASYYGTDKSLAIWAPNWPRRGAPQPVPREAVVPANLASWNYRPRPGTVAVDPVLGRILFPPEKPPRDGVEVRYHYGFSAGMGGGPYERQLAQPAEAVVLQVGQGAPYATIRAALDHWESTLRPKPEPENRNLVIEIIDSQAYVERIAIRLRAGESVQIRAAIGVRPVIRLLDVQTAGSDALRVVGEQGGRFALDGVLVTGRAVRIEGDIEDVLIRHSTLVPGWTLDSSCEPGRPTEPGLEITSPRVCVHIEHSIVGSIQILPTAADGNAPEDVYTSERAAAEAALARCKGISAGIRLDPIRLCIEDSIVDATSTQDEAIGAPGCEVAHARLTIARSTVIGEVHVHAIDLGEDTIFEGRIVVARRQEGCLRFSSVLMASRTPRRYRCQPDLALAPLEAAARAAGSPGGLSAAERELVQERLRPQFNSTRYGRPDYCQLAETCPAEISEGAEDRSEMGAFHDLFQPQRAAALEARLAEFLPAGIEAATTFIT